ncbi:MAG: oligosaccharide flippase family protein [Candidatus Dormibacteria bacterium]
MRRFAVGMAWSAFGSAVGRAFTLAATIVIARLLGPSAYGAWGLTQSTIGTAAALAALGASLTATKQVAQYRNRDLDIASGRATLALLSAVAGGIAAGGIVAIAATGIAAAAFRNASIAPLLELGAPALLFTTVSGAQLGVLIGLEEFRVVSLVNIVRGIAVGIALIAGARLFGVNGAVAGLSIGELVGAAAAQFALGPACRRASMRLDATLAWRERRTLWRFSLPTLLATLATQPSTWLGQAILAHRPDGLVQAGYFAYAYRWYLFIMFFAGALAPVGLPILTNLRATADRETHRRFLWWNVGVNLLVVTVPAIVLVGAAGFVSGLGGGGFRAAEPSLVILALACIPAALNNALGQAALSLDLVRAWVVSDVVFGLTLAGVAVLLAPSLGSLGLAWGYLAAMLATSAVLVAPVIRALRVEGRGGGK